jgi:hypothetical protein
VASRLYDDLSLIPYIYIYIALQRKKWKCLNSSLNLFMKITLILKKMEKKTLEHPLHQLLTLYSDMIYFVLRILFRVSTIFLNSTIDTFRFSTIDLRFRQHYWLHLKVVCLMRNYLLHHQLADKIANHYSRQHY